ncbi:MAG: hypothetical protein J6035_07250 [Bacteroidaceae bacterium]|nr:hypothetical protein [Bacteroidaceae bacterium]
MKKTYIEPQSEVIGFAEEDIICSSTTAEIKNEEISTPGGFGARETVDYTLSSRDAWSEEW